MFSEFYYAAVAAAILKHIDEHGAPNAFHLSELRQVGAPPITVTGAIMRHQLEDVNGILFDSGYVARYAAPQSNRQAQVIVETVAERNFVEEPA